MKKVLVTLLGVAVTVLGEMLAYHVFTSITQGGFLMGLKGVTAFVTILGGLALMVYHPLISAEKAEVHLKEKGKLVLYSFRSVALIAIVAPFVLAIVAFYHFTGKYHDEQIEKYGIVQKVLIETEITGRNSRHDLCFRYTHDGKTWDGMLSAWEYQVGDSAEIIFSSQNPNEVEWYQRYLDSE